MDSNHATDGGDAQTDRPHPHWHFRAQLAHDRLSESDNKHPRAVALADLRRGFPPGEKWKATRLPIDARHLGMDVAPLAMDPEVIR